ncbi:ADP-heptose:LPS heptosyltransferase [Novosphingobium sp. SG751A]|uniref:glycosyltransferase family 9 protein n=1 Tax=Novosphingobium sp. SG751A TaxID=2587000 RepID=UPI0015531DA5|nr:glycosyltransferase family 9 protein [Novosphingobium sp. SG751A]NOW48380.1 ADP-heptose:LPS heptosyltransferase [Novosphingobium sp. SG751A]
MSQFCNKYAGKSGEAETDSSVLLHDFFAEFLDKEKFENFRKIETLVASLGNLGQTQSGQPMMRPRDCTVITQGLEEIFEATKSQFRTGEARIIDRFERIIGEFTEHCAKVYPSEASAALVLHGKVLLFQGESQRVLDVVGKWVARPYALDSIDHILDLAELYAQAQLRLGTFDSCEISFIALGQWLAANSRSLKAMRLGPRLAPYVGLGRDAREPLTLRARLIRLASRRLLKNARIQGAIPRMVSSFLSWQMWRLILGLCYAANASRNTLRSPYSLKMNKRGTTLVTRAMGGIGDLLMMTPGLEALAAKQKAPVDFAIPRKFHAVFKGNPHIRLLDINGPAIDIASYRHFVNLGNCPASRYESGARPFIRRGRVEVFAKAMGISRHMLQRQGWRINRLEQADDAAFCSEFLAEKAIGDRPVVGVAPYSRDSYKDYPKIHQVISQLAEKFDVLIFHHVDAGLPSGPGIASTAGLSLERSLALAGRVNAMVTVDSAFLHAAAAHDYPVIGLFGPTDGKPLTRHHRQPVVLAKPDQFACVPCWRNEDSPCALTELRAAAEDGASWRSLSKATLVSANSISPCMSALDPDEIVEAVAMAIGK